MRLFSEILAVVFQCILRFESNNITFGLNHSQSYQKLVLLYFLKTEQQVKNYVSRAVQNITKLF